MNNNIKKINKKTTRSNSFLYLIFFVVFCLGVAKIYIINTLATAGAQINNYENQLSKINHENENLMIEKSNFSSLSRISSEAKKYGFVESIKMISLGADVPIALK